MIKNKFDWFQDGETKSGYFTFRANGTYDSNYSLGTWKLLDERTVVKTNKEG